MIKNVTYAYLLILVSALLPLNSISAGVYVYLDPGSGSMFLQIFLAGIAGLAVISRMYWKKIKLFFNIDKEEKNSSDTDK